MKRVITILCAGCLLTGCGTNSSKPAESSAEQTTAVTTTTESETTVTTTVTTTASADTTAAQTEETGMKIELKENVSYLEGKYFSQRLGCEITVSADLEDALSEDYILRCVDALEQFDDSMMNELNEAAKRYALGFIELCRDGAEDFSFEEFDLPEITEETPADDMPQYYGISEMYADAPGDDTELYFRLSGWCDWEPEHGFEAAFRDGKLVYLGAYEDASPSRLDYYISEEGREFNYAF